MRFMQGASFQSVLILVAQVASADVINVAGTPQNYDEMGRTGAAHVAYGAAGVLNMADDQLFIQ